MCDRKLSLSEAGQLAEVISATQGNRKVARVMDDGDLIVIGIARSIGTDNGCMDWDNDARDQFLRVTSNTGFEHFWRISDLMPEVVSGEFVIGYQE